MKSLIIMTLQEASDFFESIKTETTKKSAIKVYEKFVSILSELKTRKFTKEEIQSIESELESFNLKSNREKRANFFERKLIKFEEFLKNTFSLTSKGHYTKRGTGLGLSFGIIFGVVFLSSWERSMAISMGLIFGLTIGMLIGRSLDNKAMREGRMI